MPDSIETKRRRNAIVELGMLKEHPAVFIESIDTAIEVLEDSLCSTCGQAEDGCLCDKEE